MTFREILPPLHLDSGASCPPGYLIFPAVSSFSLNFIARMTSLDLKAMLATINTILPLIPGLILGGGEMWITSKDNVFIYRSNNLRYHRGKGMLSSVYPPYLLALGIVPSCYRNVAASFVRKAGCWQ